MITFCLKMVIQFLIIITAFYLGRFYQNGFIKKMLQQDFEIVAKLQKAQRFKRYAKTAHR